MHIDIWNGNAIASYSFVLSRLLSSTFTTLHFSLLFHDSNSVDDEKAIEKMNEQVNLSIEGLTTTCFVEGPNENGNFRHWKTIEASQLNKASNVRIENGHDIL
ncbi:hypothetical protein E2542_SST31039 [Spatholobus suberectus]|nr:hypothetical protein E2542_SST31039 [Spatholobus suberectus]